jgi:hypothetical protein
VSWIVVILLAGFTVFFMMFAWAEVVLSFRETKNRLREEPMVKIDWVKFGYTETEVAFRTVPQHRQRIEDGKWLVAYDDKCPNRTIMIQPITDELIYFSKLEVVHD